MMSGSDQLNGMSTDSRNNLPEYNEKHALQVFQAAATVAGCTCRHVRSAHCSRKQRKGKESGIRNPSPSFLSQIVFLGSMLSCLLPMRLSPTDS